ncbi:MAG: cytochrome c oxidase subunit II [Longimicrobiales bacterium]
MDSFWRLPENISTFGAEIDRLFYIIVVITGVVFVLVELLLIYFLVKYRHRPDRKASYTHGNSRLEVLWTLATAIIVVIVGVMSRGLWLDIKDPRRFPPAGLELIITAKQFEWNVTYPGGDGDIGTGDDFVVRNQLHVPVNTAVHVSLQSEDVIHSFYLPELRLKQDAVPGMQILAWFEATRTGEYTVGCAELCGLGHYRMKGAMTVHSAADWASWNTQKIAAAANRSGAALADAADAETPASEPVADLAAADRAHH